MCFTTAHPRHHRLAGRTRGDRVQVIALHCSGADGNQWRRLADALGSDVDVYAPHLIGSNNDNPWHGERAFTLLDEAQPILDSIDHCAGRVHLVGHSYGGTVALKIAAMRPKRIASLSLYEPSAFHVLRLLGARASQELAEIETIATTVCAGLLSGSYRDAAALFVDYWSGRGAWDSLRPEVRNGLLRWLPKAPLDFRAALDDGTPLIHYQQINCPVLVMRGEHARMPSRMIAEAIAEQARHGRIEMLPAAGHMGPVTHPSEVIDRLAWHIRSSRPRRAAPQNRLVRGCSSSDQRERRQRLVAPI